MKIYFIILLFLFVSSIETHNKQRINIFVDKALETNVLEFRNKEKPIELCRKDFILYLKKKGYVTPHKKTQVHFWACFRGTGFEILKKIIKK